MVVSAGDTVLGADAKTSVAGLLELAEVLAAPGRRAAPFCAQLRRAVARSQARGRIALVLLDNLGIHTPRGSRLLRALLEEFRGHLVLVYTPTYDPDANRIEWLWRALRAPSPTRTPVRPSHRSWRMPTSGHALSPQTEVLQQIGSPFADADLIDNQPLSHAA